MSVRIDKRHLAVFTLLFLVNLIVLALAFSDVGIEIRIFLLMVGCSALVSFFTAILLVALYDKIVRASKAE